jgi:hypothetical protein
MYSICGAQSRICPEPAISPPKSLARVSLTAMLPPHTFSLNPSSDNECYARTTMLHMSQTAGEMRFEHAGVSALPKRSPRMPRLPTSAEIRCLQNSPRHAAQGAATSSRAAAWCRESQELSLVCDRAAIVQAADQRRPSCYRIWATSVQVPESKHRGSRVEAEPLPQA